MMMKLDLKMNIGEFRIGESVIILHEWLTLDGGAKKIDLNYIANEAKATKFVSSD